MRNVHRKSLRPGEHFAYERCWIHWDTNQLRIGNERVERSWVLVNGLLYSETLSNRQTGRQWLAKRSAHPIIPEFLRTSGHREVEIELEYGTLSPAEEPSLVVHVISQGSSGVVRYRLQLFAESDGVLIRCEAGLDGGVGASPAPSAQPVEAPTGIELAQGIEDVDQVQGDCLESFHLDAVHLTLTQIEFMDQTDRHNELVFEKEWLLHPNEADLSLIGNLWFMEDPLTGEGLVFLKMAPLPHARPNPCPVDLIVQPKTSTCHWLGHDATGHAGGYPYVVLVYSNGRWGRTAALQRLQRRLRSYKSGRDARLLSNTWGDRSQDARICERFMQEEIKAGSRLGVEVIQIDDGWQQGKSANSIHQGGVWEGFWKHDPDFWTPSNEKFPGDLQPLIAEASRHGMLFGLWYAPDSSEDFANWEKDAETVLRLYRSGVRYFKIDGVKARTKAGERNLHAFFETVLDKSDGQVVFDLDVTAEIRPGYWGLMQVGPLFIENRYTDFHRYWPHQTLRNLWSLAHYVDPLRIRMEFLNHERNRHLYPHDPLAPGAYKADYLFAVTMFSNPLGWFECSGLSEAFFKEAAPLIQVWKRHREGLWRGTVFPIGDKPNGASWTGFASVDHAGAGYLLVMRECSSRETWSTELPLTAEPIAFERLYGEGKARLNGTQLEITLFEQKSFLFLRFFTEGKG